MVISTFFIFMKFQIVFILSYTFFLVQELWPKGKISFKHGCVFPQIHNLNGLFDRKNVPCEFTFNARSCLRARNIYFFKHENINLGTNSYYQWRWGLNHHYKNFQHYIFNYSFRKFPDIVKTIDSWFLIYRYIFDEYQRNLLRFFEENNIIKM